MERNDLLEVLKLHIQEFKTQKKQVTNIYLRARVNYRKLVHNKAYSEIL